VLGWKPTIEFFPHGSPEMLPVEIGQEDIQAQGDGLPEDVGVGGPGVGALCLGRLHDLVELVLGGGVNVQGGPVGLGCHGVLSCWWWLRTCSWCCSSMRVDVIG